MKPAIEAAAGVRPEIAIVDLGIVPDCADCLVGPVGREVILGAQIVGRAEQPLNLGIPRVPPLLIDKRGSGRCLKDPEARNTPPAQIARQTVVDFERGARRTYQINLVAIQGACEAAGVEFIPETRGSGGEVEEAWQALSPKQAEHIGRKHDRWGPARS